MAAEMAFSLIFAVFPFLIFLISVFGLLGSEEMIADLIETISVVLPSNIQNFLQSMLSAIVNSSNVGLLTFGFITALWIASNATSTFVKSINKTYQIPETRPFWKTRLIAILILIIQGVVLLIATNLIIFGKIIADFLKDLLEISVNTQYILLMLRWPLSFLALLAMALFAYYVAPNIRGKGWMKLISIVPGSIFFCVFWLFGSWLFSLYVENFGQYNETFGVLGGFIVLLTWLYFSSLIILLGGAINAEFYRRRKPVTKAGL